MEYVSTEIKSRIAKELSNRGLKPYTFFPSIGLAQGTLDKANKSMPKADTLARIADALDLSVDYLLGRSLAARPAPVASPALAEMLDIFPQLSDSAQEMLLDVARAALAREQKNAVLG